MNNKVLFVSNKKLPQQFEELKNDFDISTEKMMELGVKTDLKISYRSGNRYIYRFHSMEKK